MFIFFLATFVSFRCFKNVIFGKKLVVVFQLFTEKYSLIFLKQLLVKQFFDILNFEKLFTERIRQRSSENYQYIITNNF